MFKRLAKFRLFQLRPFQSWGLAPELQGAMPANDNLENVLRPRGLSREARRIRPQTLVCRWSLIDGGTRLGCRWQAEPVVPSAPEDLDSGPTNKRTFQSRAVHP